VKERLFGMSDAAAAMAQILARDPGFDMARLLASVKADAPVIVKAFLTHDLATLRQHCGPELMEKFAGIFKHFEVGGRRLRRAVVGRACSDRPACSLNPPCL
jgi:import inner membrane translocase subunit TIM44